MRTLAYGIIRMYDTVQYSYVHGLGSTTQTHTISVTLIAALHRGVELYVRALTIVTTMSLVPRVLQYTVYIQYSIYSAVETQIDDLLYVALLYSTDII